MKPAFLFRQDYGFIDGAAMPEGPFLSEDLSCDVSGWGVTGDFEGSARNHCGATTVLNLERFFEEKDAGKRHTGLWAASQNAEHNRGRFALIHEAVPNGPVLRLASRARRLEAREGRAWETRPFFRRRSDRIRDAVALGEPCVLLLMAGLFCWHWVIVLGWREYPDGARYLRIMDNWNRSRERFYPMSRRAAKKAAPGNPRPVRALLMGVTRYRQV